VKKIDRIREKVTILPTSVYLSKMHDAGWSLVALEWEREIEISGRPEEPPAEVGSEEIPFGLRIAADCRHLEDDPLETQTLKFLAEMIVQDISFNSPQHTRIPHARWAPLVRRQGIQTSSSPD
jgi:hypothetical protein